MIRAIDLGKAPAHLARYCLETRRERERGKRIHCQRSDLPPRHDVCLIDGLKKLFYCHWLSFHLIRNHLLGVIHEKTVNPPSKSLYTRLLLTLPLPNTSSTFPPAPSQTRGASKAQNKKKMFLKLDLVALPSHNLKSAKVFAASTMQHSTTRGLLNTKRDSYWPAKEIHFQATHSMPPEKIEIFKSMESWAEKNLLKHLKPVEKSWQPQDFLPRADSEGFYEQVEELRERAKELPDDYFVVLAGDMITEEALPTYQTALNTLDGVRDETGASLSPWAVWSRGWTAEENRHGDLLNKYLYLSGRVDMRQIEKTTQYLIGCGMDFKCENNPYNFFIYTSFQERATFISHDNTARLARRYGDNKLAHICSTIAADEKRHEIAYTMIVEKLFQIDPDTTVLALADMMRKKIVMPALLIYDGQDDNLFDNFSAVAQNLGVYTAKDYAENIEFFVGRWNVEGLTGLSGEGRRARDFVCRLPARIRRLEERAQEKANKAPAIRFSWIRY